MTTNLRFVSSVILSIHVNEVYCMKFKALDTPAEIDALYRSLGSVQKTRIFNKQPVTQITTTTSNLSSPFLGN